MKKTVLENFAIFIRKDLYWILFFTKVGGLRTASLLKTSLQHTCFPVNIAKFLRIPIFLKIVYERLFLSFEDLLEILLIFTFIKTLYPRLANTKSHWIVYKLFTDLFHIFGKIRTYFFPNSFHMKTDYNHLDNYKPEVGWL